MFIKPTCIKYVKFFSQENGMPPFYFGKIYKCVRDQRVKSITRTFFIDNKNLRQNDLANAVMIEHDCAG